MERGKLSRPWKLYGYIILVALAILIVFDVTVWVVYEIHWNKYVKVSVEAKEAGYPDSYDICSRQGNIIIDDREYMLFEAHREAILDGDYYENLLVALNDDYNDNCPGKKDNLEIFAKEIGYVYDNNQERYTIIDVYQIDLCRDNVSGDWVWRAICLTIIAIPIILVAGLVWFIHFIICKKRS